MATVDDYKRALLEAHRAGDERAAKLFAEKIKQMPVEEDLSIGDRIVGGAETLATIGSGAIAEPISGLAGLAQAANPWAEQGAGARAVEATQEALTYQPRTESGRRVLQATGEALEPIGDAIQGAEQYLGDTVYEATDSPALAAAATAIPTAAGELIGLGAGRKVVKAADTATDAAQAEFRAAQSAAQAREGGVGGEGIEAGIETITQGSPEDISEFMNLDGDVFRAADELGISAEPLAAFASQNSQFRDISGALRSVPGSMLDVQAREFIRQTADAADNLILEYGGTLDKAELGDRFKRESLSSVDHLAAQADDAYTAIREQLPLNTKLKPNETISFIEGQIEDLGGVENLPKDLRGLYETLKSENGVTYGLLDMVRKEFGAATRKGQGRFKDAETGVAKAMYNRITKDLETEAQRINPDVAPLIDTAKDLVKRRKVLEDDLTALYGKEMNKSLNTLAGGAVKGLQKGKVDEFLNVFNRIPKEKRGEAVITYMNDAFKGAGVDREAFDATQFSKWYESLSRSPRAKNALYSNLPKGAGKAVDNLYKVAKGISRSNQQTVKTGAINSMFNPETGMIRKLVGKGAGLAANAVLGGNLSGFALDATTDFLKQSSSGAKAASNMLASPEFQNLMRESVKEGYVQGRKISKRLEDAEAKLQKTQAYQKWANALDADSRAALIGGVLPYLFTAPSEQAESNEARQEEQEQR